MQWTAVRKASNVSMCMNKSSCKKKFTLYVHSLKIWISSTRKHHLPSVILISLISRQTYYNLKVQQSFNNTFQKLERFCHKRGKKSLLINMLPSVLIIVEIFHSKLANTYKDRCHNMCCHISSSCIPPLRLACCLPLPGLLLFTSSVVYH